jgi:hypothetical protein
MLTSLLQKQSKDVRLRAAFMPSGTVSGCRAGRMGNLTGMVSLIELQDVYAALGCHILDDGYFEEILQNTWEFKEEGTGGGQGRRKLLEGRARRQQFHAIAATPRLIPLCMRAR